MYIIAICFSHIGYAKHCVTFSQIRETITLNRTQTILKELTIIPAEHILDKVARRLTDDYAKSKNTEGSYLCRFSEEFQGKHEMVEALINAKANVAIRDMSIILGQRFQLRNYNTHISSLSKTNLHHLFELCPGKINSPFWSGLITPLHNKEYKKSYRTSCTSCIEEDGSRLYIFDFYKSALQNGSKHLEGTTNFPNHSTLYIICLYHPGKQHFAAM